MIKVSTVILNWNGYKDTLQCLASIEKMEIPSDIDHEVIIVDNNSTDESISKFSRSKFDFTLLQSKTNRGFAGGNNIGIKHALRNKSDYIFVLNNDTEVDKLLLTHLVAVAKSHPKAGLISPKIYFAKGFEFHKDSYRKNDLGNVIWYAGGVIDWNNIYGSNFGVDEIDKGQYDKIKSTDFATGAAMFINAKALRKVGLFDERYFLYMEDADLSQRMKKKKWDVIYSPKPVLWHKVSQSSGIGSDLNDYFITRNRLLFGMRYASLRTKIALSRESIKMLINGRKWQKVGVMDYYIGNFGKGSWA